MAGTVVADTLQADSTSTLVLKNGVANTPPTVQDSAGTQIGTFCRAWVNFNGTGTVAIRASFNVSSITDNGTGNYTVNLTTAMADANYSANVTAGGVGVGRQPITSASVDSSGNTVAPTTSAFRFNTVNVSITQQDPDYLNVAIFR